MAGESKHKNNKVSCKTMLIFNMKPVNLIYKNLKGKIQKGTNEIN
jgi:hypothetical protein